MTDLLPAAGAQALDSAICAAGSPGMAVVVDGAVPAGELSSGLGQDDNRVWAQAGSLLARLRR